MEPRDPEHSHEPGAIAARLAEPQRPRVLKDLVYGGIDGAVTTFAVVSGVAGAGLASEIVIILGLANLVGDGFSMAAGNYLGTRAEQEQHDRARRMEERHVERYPEGEREEIRQVFAAKGLEGQALEDVVRVVTGNRRLWIETMLREELGVPPLAPAPGRAAAATFAAFISAGLVPLLPFLVGALGLALSTGAAYAASAWMTGVTFFVIGAAKSRVVDRPWLRSGLQTLLIGGTAAALAYGVGWLVAGLA